MNRHVDRPSRSYPANNYVVTKLGPSDENLKKKVFSRYKQIF